MASISSINITHGDFSLAVSNSFLTLAAPTPTNISMNSEPLADIKLTPASPATALASRVLPVPGSPSNNIPLGILAPALTYLSGFLRKSTTSTSSFLASSQPATSAKVIFTFSTSDNLGLGDSLSIGLEPNELISKPIARARRKFTMKLKTM